VPRSPWVTRPTPGDALLKRFGAQEDERRQILQLGLIIERDTRAASAPPVFTTVSATG